MSTRTSIQITIVEESASERERLLICLHDQLRAAAIPEVEISMNRSAEFAQNWADTIMIVMTSSATLALARGLSTFIAKRGTKISVKSDSGELLITGDAASQANLPKTLAAIMTKELPSENPDVE